MPSSPKARAGRARRLVVALLAAAAVALALWRIAGIEAGVVATPVRVGETPATVWARGDAGPGPAVVIAHGFSGSRPLMRALAVALAQRGWRAVTFDFLGHGRHPRPMGGDLGREDGATAALVAQLADVVAFARALPGADGRVALLGHSMAGDPIARLARAEGARVLASVGLSVASPAVDGREPGNLLMIVGAGEPGLRDWALAALRAACGPDAGSGATCGDLAAGTARRVVVAPRVEHVGVLWSPVALAEAADWLDAAAGRAPGPPPEGRGPWVLLLVGGLVALGWPLAALLPRLAPATAPALRGWRFWLAALGPAAATPLLLAPLDVRLLPVAVGDYLALHFLAMGALTWGAVRLLARGRGNRGPGPRAGAPTASPGPSDEAPARGRGGARSRSGGAAVHLGFAVLAALAVAAWAVGAVGLALDAHVSAFVPTAARAPLILALLAGTLPYFLADERLTRAPGAPRLAYPATKLALLASLAGAVALNPERLFFLLILAPALALFVTVYGLFSHWAFSRTADPRVGGIAVAIAFAWGIGVTFPLIAP